MSASEIVSKVWNYTHVLRDNGVDYVEPITFSTILKTANTQHDITQTINIST